MKDTFTRKEIAEITGIPDRRVLFYTEQDILPGFVKTVGRGTARGYSKSDLFYLLVVKELDSLGLSLTRIKGVINMMSVFQFKCKLPRSMGIAGINLWDDGNFTKDPRILIINLHPDVHVLSPDSEGYNDEFDFTWITESTEFSLKADKPSQIIINLNLIAEKAGL